MHTWKSYGVPFEFLRITTKGCFAERMTYSEFHVETLVLDLAVFFVVGVFIKRSFNIVQSIRRRLSKVNPGGTE